MKKMIGILLMVAMLLLTFPVSTAAQAVPVDAKAALLMEAHTGRVLFADNEHEKLPPASVTKVMTMLLIYEALDNGRIEWDQVVTVSAHAAGMGGSQVYLEEGEQQTVRDLVKAIVIASANDAAVAMAEHVAGSESAFVQMMNDRAAALGMENTHFKNACGLDAPGHLTTAYDIALMSRQLITQHPAVFDYTTQRLDKIIHKTARGEEEFGLTNTNKLLRQYTGITGLKTGSTGEALYCFSATAERDGMALVAVVLGAPNPAARFGGAAKLFDYGFAQYAVLPQEATDTVLGQVTVYKGKQETADAVVQTQVAVLVPKGNNVEITSEVQLQPSVNAPLTAGTKLGEVVYTHNGEEVGRGNLIAAQTVEKAGPGDMMERLFQRWISN